MAKARFILSIALVCAMLNLLLLAEQATANSEAAQWQAVDMPQSGEDGGWVLAEGSDVRHLTASVDGTLYCYANPSATDYTLFSSTDGGYSWSHVGKVKDSIIAIACAPDDAKVICYATTSQVYLSMNAGESFSLLPPSPGGAGSNNVEITSIAIGRRDGRSTLAVGTRDTDSSQYGGIHVLDESKFLWTNAGVGNYDVYAVAFSPGFATDGQLIAVVTDETDTFVTTRIGEGEWGSFTGDARLNRDNSVIPTPVAVDTSAAIAFPDGYNAFTEDAELFVAIDAGAENGDVYKIRSVAAPGASVATDLNIGSAYSISNIDITSLALTGRGATASLMAGAAGSTRVYFSSDGGSNWRTSTKPPTGGSRTYVLLAAGFNSRGKTCAGTSGTGSAFSRTEDGGTIWNQVSLIDTRIDTIVDLAPSPNYSKDNTLFMLTSGAGSDSLWRTLNGGTRWERVFASGLPTVSNIERTGNSPRYGSGSQVVFAAGQSGGNPAIWKSTDNGQSFGAPRIPRDPSGGGAVPIDAWATVNDETLFVGSFDGSNGLVYRTESSGLFYTSRATAGTKSLNSIALSPSFDRDKTILAGNTFGSVYWSKDNGESFVLLGQQLPDLIVGGSDSNNVAVAFDPEYSRNSTVYASSHCKKGSSNSSTIYRFVIDKSAVWESIGTMPAGAIIDRLVVSAGGTLCAMDSRVGGGVQRCLDPTYPLGPSFEAASNGLDSSATLTGLWIQENQLWSTETTTTRLVSFDDSLAVPAALASPKNGAGGVDIENVKLEWETLKGATDYQWQLDYDTNFSSVPTGFEGTIKSSSARLPSLQYATKYYWRVRATEPVASPWSDKWSFTTGLGSAVVAPEARVPKAGAAGVSPKPVFQWSAVAGAERYELLVSSNVSFAQPVIVKVGEYALPGTAWECDVSLDYGTTFYWKVRALGSDTSSVWGAVSAFTTGLPAEPLKQPESPLPESLPLSKSIPSLFPTTSLPPLQPPPAQLPPPQPAPQAAPPDWIGWLMHLGTAFLVTMLAMVVTLILLTIRVWKI